jgi:hypothetical protein
MQEATPGRWPASVSSWRNGAVRRRGTSSLREGSPCHRIDTGAPKGKPSAELRSEHGARAQPSRETARSAPRTLSFEKIPCPLRVAASGRTDRAQAEEATEGTLKDAPTGCERQERANGTGKRIGMAPTDRPGGNAPDHRPGGSKDWAWRRRRAGTRLEMSGPVSEGCLEERQFTKRSRAEETAG